MTAENLAFSPRGQGFLVREWALPTSEVAIEEGEDGVLGRGSYGEVRIATWRGVRWEESRDCMRCTVSSQMSMPHTAHLLKAGRVAHATAHFFLFHDIIFMYLVCAARSTTSEASQTASTNTGNCVSPSLSNRVNVYPQSGRKATACAQRSSSYRKPIRRAGSGGTTGPAQ